MSLKQKKEHSYFEARFGTPERTPTTSNNRAVNFNFCYVKI